MKNLAPIVFFIFTLLPLLVIGQTPAISFQRIGNAEGLSQSFVHCLEKDDSGFVWVGTQDGLNRFDGGEFISHFNNPADTTSLSNNYIWDLYQDDHSNLWIGTNGGGLGLYESAYDRFSSFYLEAEPSKNAGQHSVRSIFETASGNLLVGTDLGLYLFDLESQRFKKLNPTGTNPDFSKSIFSFERLSDDLILVGSIGVLFVYDENSRSLEPVKLGAKIEGGFHCFAKSEEGLIWAGTGKGLYQFEWISDADSIAILKQFKAEDKIAAPISSNFISALLLKENNLWIATDDGLNSYDIKKEIPEFQQFKNDASDINSLSSNLIFDLLEVEEGIIWAATQSGINQFSIKPPLFKTLNFKNGNGFFCGNSVHGMAVDESGLLLFCTEKGLVVKDLEFKDSDLEFPCYTKTQWPDLKDEFLVSISPSQGAHHWAALRRGGYAKIVRAQNNLELTAYQLPAGAYSGIGTNDIVESANGDLWIASSGLGLWKLDRETGEYVSFAKKENDSFSLSGNYIFYLLEDHSGFLWIATADGGLCRMDKKTEVLECFTHDEKNRESISSNMVLSVFEDSQHRIWACTSNGLNLFSADGKFIRFYKKDGLPNDVVYGMLEDNNGGLWVSTNQGVSYLNFENGELSTKNYSDKNGLLNNEFNQHAFLELPNGQLAFGTQGGINYFDPEAIKDYTVLPQVVFTDFKLFNESVLIKPGLESKRFYLDKHINAIQKISLPYHKNFLAFEFSGINFEEATSNQYAYLMEGLDEDWVYSGTRNYANYPALKPGEYTFRVKAANHDGLWNERPRSIAISVAVPPWKTWWAYFLYFLLGFAVVYCFFKYRLYNVRKIEQTKQQERTLFRKRSARDFHDEAGNHITKISLMTEIAKRKSENNMELKDLLSQIGEDVQTLRSGMRDFIWVLDPDKDNLFETLLRLKESANGIFEYSPIVFTTSGINEDLESIPLDSNKRRHLLLIFKEAINNCLKYSEAKNAHLSVEKKGEALYLKFVDDGIGYDSKITSSGYGLQNMEARAKKIKAQLKMDTEKNKGSTVCLILNTTQMGN